MEVKFESPKLFMFTFVAAGLFAHPASDTAAGVVHAAAVPDVNDRICPAVPPVEGHVTLLSVLLIVVAPRDVPSRIVNDPDLFENVPAIVNVPLFAIVNPSPPGPEMYTFVAEIVPCTTAPDAVKDVVDNVPTVPVDALIVVIAAYDRVVVPDETVRLLEKIPLPTTSRATDGVFPIPKYPADISPWRYGLDDTVEYTKNVFAALILYPPEGLLPRTRAFA